MCASPVAGISSKHSPKHKCMCVCERKMRACVYVCVFVSVTECVWSVPWSDSCMPSSWMEKASLWWLPSGTHTSLQPLFSSPLLSCLCYFSFPHLLCFPLFPFRQWFYADHLKHILICLISPCFCCPILPLLFFHPIRSTSPIPFSFFYYYSPITIITKSKLLATALCKMRRICHS